MQIEGQEVKMGDQLEVKGKGKGKLESLHEGKLNVRLESGDLITASLEDCKIVKAPEKKVELTAVEKAEEEEQKKHDAELAKERDDIRKAKEDKEKADAKADADLLKSKPESKPEAHK